MAISRNNKIYGLFLGLYFILNKEEFFMGDEDFDETDEETSEETEDDD